MTDNYRPEPGHRVRVRRYEVPCPELRDRPYRKLVIEATGTVLRIEGSADNGVMHLDPGSISVQVDQIMPDGPREDHARVGLGYVFLGQDADHGVSWTLETEVTRLDNDGGPGSPLCCQRYGLLHSSTFSLPGCPWYEGSPQRAYDRLTAGPFSIPGEAADAALKYARVYGVRRLVGAGHDIGISYVTNRGFRVYDLTEDAQLEEYMAMFGDPS